MSASADEGERQAPVAAVCRAFGLRADGLAIDAGGASSLAAVAAACLELERGDIDMAIAGGVDIGLAGLRDLAAESCGRQNIGIAGPPGGAGMSRIGGLGYAEIGVLTRLGVLATGDMRIYDQNPTGFLPGEGCGMVLLMRTADALAADLPVHAEIVGWGLAADGPSAGRQQPPSGLLAAMRAAYDMAGVDPFDIALIEGCGTGVAATEEAELAALATLRADAGAAAVLGSITANIGNTQAAAGAAGLIKAVLAITSGVLPPSTGVRTPHRLLLDAGSGLRLAAQPEPWPGIIRHAGVSAIGPGKAAVHLVLRRTPWRSSAGKTSRGRMRASGKARSSTRPDAANWTSFSRPPGRYPAGSHFTFAYLLRASDLPAMAAQLSRIAELAPRLSDGQAQDLAVHLSKTAADRSSLERGQCPIRVGIVATCQEELADRASEALLLLPQAGRALLATPGIFAAGDVESPELCSNRRARQRGSRQVAGRASLLLASQPNAADLPQRELSRMLAVIARLDALGVDCTAAAGLGIGEIAGLVWAGCTDPITARGLITLRSAALADPREVTPGQLSTLIEKISAFDFQPPRRRLLSGRLGTALRDHESVVAMLSAELLQRRLAARGAGRELGYLLDEQAQLNEAVRAAADGADLLLQTGLDWHLARAVRGISPVPVVSIDGDPADDRQLAHAAAALFTVGALTKPEALYADRPGRPIDIRRDLQFIEVAARVRAPEADLPEPTEQEETEQEPSEAEPSEQDASEPLPIRQEITDSPTRSPATAPDGATSGCLGADTVSPLPVGGIGWVRCFAEQPAPVGDQARADDGSPFRVVTGGCGPLERKVREIFPHDPLAARTLAVLGDLDDAGAREAVLLAARGAISTGSLVAITQGQALDGFWATLHAEHPEVGLTVLRTPLTADGLRAASRVAQAVPGEYRELVVGAGGGAAEPLMVPMALPGGATFPIGPRDVALISRSSGAAGLVLAQVLACSGAAVVLVGPQRPRQDDELVAELERLRDAGARVGIEVVEMSDHGALNAAVARIEARYGRITAVSHATSTTMGRAIASMRYNDVHEELRNQAATLDQLVAAVRAAGRGLIRRPVRLRHIITFGSVAGRYGLPSGGMLALATGALADQARHLASTVPGCRALHVDWPSWRGPGLGDATDLAEICDRSGITPLSVADGSRMLLKLLATKGLPGRVAVHGRVGVPAPRQLGTSEGTGIPAHGGRFIERVLVHYPGLELIAEATLSFSADPYLGDYQVDGMPVLPPTMALEAMAQAAAVLTGTAARRATEVTIAAPVVLPASREESAVVIRAVVIRVCAVHDGGAVTVVLRSDNSDFAVDHCQARFPAEPGVRRHGEAARTAIVAAASGPAAARRPAAAWVDAASIYGPLCFQTGRFRRLTTLRPSGSRAAIAVAYGPDTEPWFGDACSAEYNVTDGLMLGSAGLNDAVLQLVQACVPHRRLMLAGCDSFSVSGLAPVGLVTLGVNETEQPMAELEPGRGESLWDAEVTDATGQVLAAWRGLRMRHAGPLPQSRPWPIPQLASYLERAATELGLGPDVRVEVALERGADENAPSALSLSVHAAIPASAGWHRTTMADVEAAAGVPGSGRGWLAMLDGLSPRLSHLGSTLQAPATTQPAMSMAASRATAAVAAALEACVGREGAPPDLTAAARHIVGVDWLVLMTGDARIACTVLDVEGLGQTAFALMTGAAAAEAGACGSQAPGTEGQRGENESGAQGNPSPDTRARSAGRRRKAQPVSAA